MKKLLLLTIILLCSFNNFGQTQESPSLTELLERYHAIPPNGNSVSHYFTSSEITVLQEHFDTSLNDVPSENRGSDVATIFASSFDDDAFVSFSVDTPDILNILGDNANTTDSEVAGDIDPQDLNTAYILTLNAGEFYSLDITTATYTLLGTITAPDGGLWGGLEFDPSTNILYGMSTNFTDTNDSTLSIIDIDALTATSVGTTGTTVMVAIAIDDQSNMYGHDVVSDSFYTIDITTGNATLIGPLGFNADFAQDLEWDSSTQTLYMTAFNIVSFRGEFRTVNIETGETTFISNLGISGSNIPWASIRNPTTLGLSDNTIATLSVFPNPAKDRITIRTTNPSTSIKVINIVGQVVIENSTLENQQIVNISKLSSGIYFLQATNESGNQKVVRFIKE